MGVGGMGIVWVRGPWKSHWPFEDAFPIKNGGFSNFILVFGKLNPKTPCRKKNTGKPVDNKASKDPIVPKNYDFPTENQSLGSPQPFQVQRALWKKDPALKMKNLVVKRENFSPKRHASSHHVDLASIQESLRWFNKLYLMLPNKVLFKKMENLPLLFKKILPQTEKKLQKLPRNENESSTETSRQGIDSPWLTAQRLHFTTMSQGTWPQSRDHPKVCGKKQLFEIVTTP